MRKREFDTLDEAYAHVTPYVERQVKVRRRQLAPGLMYHCYPVDLPGGAHTNVYEVVYSPRAVQGSVQILPELATPLSHALDVGGCSITTGAGFFFVADQYDRRPRQPSFNLTISQGRVLSLPLVDREAVVAIRGQLTVEPVAAKGELELDGRRLTWAGSRSRRQADTTVYGSANITIEHEYDRFDAPRILRPDSCYTPSLLPDSGLVDVGFLAEDDGSFTGRVISSSGQVDVTAHDLVLRCQAEHLGLQYPPRLKVISVGHLKLDQGIEGAVSVGASLLTNNFLNHPLNRDRSLGSFPPLDNRRLARLVFYRTTAGFTHLRLYDGWQRSKRHTGVTPEEAVALIGRHNIEWGCTLDSGRGAKLVVTRFGQTDSHGNHHYIHWPTDQNPGPYRWDPQAGRPVASLIRLQAK